MYAYFPLRLFPMGQVSIYTAVPPEVLNLPLYPDGRRLYFIFSPDFVLGITAFLLCSLCFLRYRRLQTPFFLLLFLCGAGSALISGASTYYSPTFSFLFALTQVGQVAFFFLAFFLVKTLPLSKRQELWITVLLIASICMVFEAGVAFLQFVVRGPLGIGIEGVDIAPYFGAGADESNLIPRSLGLRVHSNSLAYEWIAFPFVILGALRSHWMKKRSYYWKFFFQGVFVMSCFLLLLTVSRAAWIAFGVGLGLIFFWDKEFMHQQIQVFLTRILSHRWIFYVLIFSITAVVPLRVIKSLESFASEGGAEVRSELRTVAFHIFATRAGWGVGPGMFIPAGFDVIWGNSVLFYFPEAVHNGFWLLLSEQGMIGFLLFSSAMFFLGRSIFLSSSKNSDKLLGYSAVSMLIVMIMVLFHPFNPFLHWPTMLAILALYKGEV